MTGSGLLLMPLSYMWAQGRSYVVFCEILGLSYG